MNWRVLPHTDFPKYKEQWAQLNNETMRLAFFEPEFVDALATYFFEGDELLVLALEEENLVFAAFLRPLGKGQWTLAMPSQNPLGLMLHKSPILDNKIVSQLANALPGSVAMIDFLQTDTRHTQFASEGAFESMPYITTGNRPIPENFDDYFKSLGKNMRQNYNKVNNRAARAEDKLSWHKVDTRETVKQAILEYGEIESAGWKNEKGTAISPDNEQGQFYLKALSEMADKGQACCWYFLINDQKVAVDLCIQKDDCLIILKTTYNEEFNKQSPALMLKLEMLKHYTENKQTEGISNIEFYGKAMEWHKRLDSELREIVHVTWYKNSLVKSGVKLLKKLKS